MNENELKIHSKMMEFECEYFGDLTLKKFQHIDKLHNEKCEIEMIQNDVYILPLSLLDWKISIQKKKICVHILDPQTIDNLYQDTSLTGDIESFVNELQNLEANGNFKKDIETKNQQTLADNECDYEYHTIRLIEEYENNDIVLLHEMIHAYDLLIDGMIQPDCKVKVKDIRELLVSRIFSRLSTNIDDKEKMDKLLCNYPIEEHGILFTLKSFLIDSELKYTPGTVFGRGMEDFYKGL